MHTHMTPGAERVSNDEFFEELAKEYPELFEQSDITTVAIPVGWYNIVTAMCTALTENVVDAKNHLRAAELYPRNDNGAYLAECTTALTYARTQLPVISSIRRVLGRLNVIVGNASPGKFGDRLAGKDSEGIIRMASIMSTTTCYVCGAPGKRDLEGSSILDVTCREHATPPQNIWVSYKPRIVDDQ